MQLEHLNAAAVKPVGDPVLDLAGEKAPQPAASSASCPLGPPPARPEGRHRDRGGGRPPAAPKTRSPRPQCRRGRGRSQATHPNRIPDRAPAGPGRSRSAPPRNRACDAAPPPGSTRITVVLSSAELRQLPQTQPNHAIRQRIREVDVSAVGHHPPSQRTQPSIMPARQPLHHAGSPTTGNFA